MVLGVFERLLAVRPCSCWERIPHRPGQYILAHDFAHRQYTKSHVDNIERTVSLCEAQVHPKWFRKL